MRLRKLLLFAVVLCGLSGENVRALSLFGTSPDKARKKTAKMTDELRTLKTQPDEKVAKEKRRLALAKGMISNLLAMVKAVQDPETYRRSIVVPTGQNKRSKRFFLKTTSTQFEQQKVQQDTRVRTYLGDVIRRSATAIKTAEESWKRNFAGIKFTDFKMKAIRSYALKINDGVEQALKAHFALNQQVMAELQLVVKEKLETEDARKNMKAAVADFERRRQEAQDKSMRKAYEDQQRAKRRPLPPPPGPSGPTYDNEADIDARIAGMDETNVVYSSGGASAPPPPPPPPPSDWSTTALPAPLPPSRQTYGAPPPPPPPPPSDWSTTALPAPLPPSRQTYGAPPPPPPPPPADYGRGRGYSEEEVDARIAGMNESNVVYSSGRGTVPPPPPPPPPPSQSRRYQRELPPPPPSGVAARPRPGVTRTSPEGETVTLLEQIRQREARKGEWVDPRAERVAQPAAPEEGGMQGAFQKALAGKFASAGGWGEDEEEDDWGDDDDTGW